MWMAICVREGILLGGGGRKQFALKITICPKNKQFALKVTFLVWSEWGLKPLVNLFCNVEFAHNAFVGNVNSPITLYLFGPDSIFYMHFHSLIHCIEFSITVQDFWATCACPERQSVPWIHCIEYIFLSIRILSNLRLPWKQSLPWKFSLYWIYLYIKDVWETCACPGKQSVPWIHCIEYIFFII